MHSSSPDDRSRTSTLGRILKQQFFARWQSSKRLSDASLCEAVREMESGLIDAHLGGALFKKRLARAGGGKRSGYRAVLSANIGSRYIFLHGFAKNERDNVTAAEAKVLRFTGMALLKLSKEALRIACEKKELLEVRCEQNH